MLRILKIIEDTMVDGPGLRSSIYCAGCAHACPGCHNPQSWNFSAGEPMTTEQVMQRLLNNPFDDVTFTGGDPMYQAHDFAVLARKIRQRTNKTIWCYTGFKFEQLLNMPQPRELLELCDVLVDGEYKESERDISLRFRGSRNQRIIDVGASLKNNKVILWSD